MPIEQLKITSIEDPSLEDLLDHLQSEKNQSRYEVRQKVHAVLAAGGSYEIEKALDSGKILQSMEREPLQTV